MSNPDLLKLELANKVLDSFKFVYKDYSARWNDLERKAQGTIAIAGIILAGGFAFVEQIRTNTPCWKLFLLVVVVLLLLGTISIAVISLIIREVRLPPSAKEIEEVAVDILKKNKDGELLDRVQGIVYDQSDIWKECIKKLREGCEKKATKIIIAQWLVLAAAFLISVVTISEVFKDQSIISKGGGKKMECSKDGCQEVAVSPGTRCKDHQLNPEQGPMVVPSSNEQLETLESIKKIIDSSLRNGKSDISKDIKKIKDILQ